MEKVNKSLIDYMDHKEIQKKEEEKIQRVKRDQRQREGSYEVRKKVLKTKGTNIVRKAV